jgi:hypothetical protein
MATYRIVLVDQNGNEDSYAAGDPTVGRNANEFQDADAARTAINFLDSPEPGCRWECREN